MALCGGGFKDDVVDTRWVLNGPIMVAGSAGGEEIVVRGGGRIGVVDYRWRGVGGGWGRVVVKSR